VRQQEVMSYLVQAMERNQLFRDQLRTYTLPKSPTYYGYGIAFHTEAIQPSAHKHKLVYPFIEIEPASPAADVGMNNGQRVVAVNGEFVNKSFLTIEDIVAASYRDQPAQDRILPRLCRLKRTKRDDPYGFDFKTLRADGRHVATNVKLDYPAYLAGLRDNDYILDVNSEAVTGMEHDAVVARICFKPNEVDLLVVSTGHIARQHDMIMTLPLYQVASGNSLSSTNPDTNDLNQVVELDKKIEDEYTQSSQSDDETVEELARRQYAGNYRVTSLF
jgi:membrane-associated protease RseP (regulator of RpoE activity)